MLDVGGGALVHGGGGGLPAGYHQVDDGVEEGEEEEGHQAGHQAVGHSHIEHRVTHLKRG